MSFNHYQTLCYYKINLARTSVSETESFPEVSLTFELHGDQSFCQVPTFICDISPRITKLNHLALIWLRRATVCQPHCLWIPSCACLYSFLSVLLHSHHPACGLALISCGLSSVLFCCLLPDECTCGVCWQALRHNRDRLA